MRALDLWHEPIELLEAGEGLFSGLTELLLDLASKSEAVLANKPATPTGEEPKLPTTPRQGQSEQDIQDFFKLQSNAMQILFGLAVLTGSHELITKALDAMHEFEQKSTKKNAEEVLALCQPALKSYLAHIVHAVQGAPAYHAMHSQHLSAVYGIGELYCTSRLSPKNTSITTDGQYLYLYIAHAQRGRTSSTCAAILYKLGTGEGGTVAGKKYCEVQTEREGDVTWVYCQGRLYARRTNEEFGSLVIYDAVTLKRLGDARLVCGDLFGGNKTLKAQNASHPLLSDGEHLYTITFQVERRERKPKESLAAEAKALVDTKRKEKEDKEKGAKKPGDGKDAPLEKSATLKSQDSLGKRMRVKSKKSLRGQPPEAPTDPKKAAGDATASPSSSVAVYYVAAFTLHQFDVSSLSQEQAAEEWDSLTDAEVLALPDVQEMFASFAGLFSPRDCARALKYNQDDFEEAATWLIESKQKPSSAW